MDAFELAKVSVDFQCKNLADVLGLPYVNLDSTDAKEKLDGTAEILIAKIMQFDPTPYEPFYDVSIIVGVKIPDDTNGYRLTELLKQVRPFFTVDNQINVGNYATSLTPSFDGYLVILRSTITASDYEGFNLVQVLQVTMRGIIDAS